jgi:hypothetical protein
MSKKSKSAKGLTPEQPPATEDPTAPPFSSSETRSPEIIPAHLPETPATPLTVFQYLMMNAIFYSLCLIILLFVRLTMQETRGLWYFFALIMVSFTLVSIYDFLYDRLSRSDEGQT